MVLRVNLGPLHLMGNLIDEILASDNAKLYVRTEKRLKQLPSKMSSGILKAKQKLGITFNSDKLGGIDFSNFSKLTMCSA